MCVAFVQCRAQIFARQRACPLIQDPCFPPEGSAAFGERPKANGVRERKRIADHRAIERFCLVQGHLRLGSPAAFTLKIADVAQAVRPNCRVIGCRLRSIPVKSQRCCMVAGSTGVLGLFDQRFRTMPHLREMRRSASACKG